METGPEEFSRHCRKFRYLRRLRWLAHQTGKQICVESWNSLAKLTNSPSLMYTTCVLSLPFQFQSLKTKFISLLRVSSLRVSKRAHTAKPGLKSWCIKMYQTSLFRGLICEVTMENSIKSFRFPVDTASQLMYLKDTTKFINSIPT